jgi:cytoskeleton protein RodZ
MIASPGAARPQTEAVPEAEEQAEGQEFVFEDEAMTRWFDVDATIVFPLNGNMYRLQLINIDGDLTVKVPGGTLDMTVGQDRQLDVNGDGRNDLRILLNDIDATDVAKRANLSLYKITKAAPAQVSEAAEVTEGEQGAASTEGGLTTSGESTAPEAGEATAPEALEAPPGAIPIITANSPAPFRVTVSFRGYCLFRYLVDNDIREERFFHKGENFSLDARNDVWLWISNAGVVRLMVAGKEMDVGGAGAVTTKHVRWRRDEASGQYTLEVVTQE